MFRNRRNNVLWFGSRRLFSAKKIVLTQTKWRINGMKKVGIFMADGCEEIEGLTVVDIVRRAKLEMTTISITDKKEVTSSHNVTFLTDALASEVDFDGFDAIAFGCPSMGVEQLEESEFEPMFIACEPKLGGKKVALFGSYGWGDGEWMRNWEETCTQDGAVLACDSVTCNDAPDDEACAACEALGKALA